MTIDDKKYTWGYIIVLAVIIVLCLIGGLFGEANAEPITESEAMAMDDWNDWENYTTEIKYLGGSDIHYMGYSQHNKVTNEYRYIVASTHKANCIKDERRTYFDCNNEYHQVYITKTCTECTGKSYETIYEKHELEETPRSYKYSSPYSGCHTSNYVCKICNRYIEKYEKHRQAVTPNGDYYHLYVGRCIYCNVDFNGKTTNERHDYINGKCTICKHECAHPNYDNGICRACGYTCNHTWVLSNTIVTRDYKYQDYYKCDCGSEKFELRNIPESDWSDWTYYGTYMTNNKYYDTYQRSITVGAGISYQYKDVDHVHVATIETANRSYAWHAAGDNCQYSVTRKCERCDCGYEDIKTVKNHEYKLDRVEDGHDILVCVSCGDVINREHVHTWTESDVEESDRQYLHSSNMCYLEKHYEKCVCGAKHQIGAVEYKHEMQCVGHVDSTVTKHGYNEYCCANCDYSYRVKLPLISEYMYEKYYDEETGISYFESNVTSEYYYRALTEDGYIYAASFEELFVTIFGEEYDPLYFEEYYPHALTIETGIYVCPEV